MPGYYTWHSFLEDDISEHCCRKPEGQDMSSGIEILLLCGRMKLQENEGNDELLGLILMSKRKSQPQDHEG
jgi:hypothetical protein